jgi:hypothetical protein
MDHSYIGINLPNMVSIVLMAVVGFVLLGAISASIQTYRNG